MTDFGDWFLDPKRLTHWDRSIKALGSMLSRFFCASVGSFGTIIPPIQRIDLTILQNHPKENWKQLWQ